jgi:uncharacterized protein YndB with AHSA1/START domain
MLRQLFYSGPSIEVLHEEYAKKGRIDGEAPVQASHEVRVNAPVERVWELLSNVPGWTAWDPTVHDVHLDSTVAEDARFTWANGRARIKSRFAVVDPGRELTWTGVSSGAKAVDRHVLEATDDGATRVRSEESMAGPLLVLFYNSAKLQADTERWLTTIKTTAERR